MAALGPLELVLTSTAIAPMSSVQPEAGVTVSV